MRNALAAALVAILAYLAWIPAVAENANPKLALVASILFYSSVLAFVVIIIHAALRVRTENKRRAHAETAGPQTQRKRLGVDVLDDAAVYVRRLSGSVDRVAVRPPRPPRPPRPRALAPRAGVARRRCHPGLPAIYRPY